MTSSLMAGYPVPRCSLHAIEWMDTEAISVSQVEERFYWYVNTDNLLLMTGI